MGAPAHTHPEPSSQDQRVLPQPWPQEKSLGPGPLISWPLWALMERWAAMEGIPFRPGATPQRQRACTSSQLGGTQTSTAGGPGEPKRRGQAAGAPPPPPPRGALSRAGGHYQESLPLFDYLLYIFNPLQEFLEECRGDRSKQGLLQGPPPSSQGRGPEGRQRWVRMAGTWGGAGKGGGSRDRCARSKC